MPSPPMTAIGLAILVLVAVALIAGWWTGDFQRVAITFVSRVSGLTVNNNVSPAQYLAPAQTHTAGNLLVACIPHRGSTIGSINNLAQDTWIRTPTSPFADIDTTHGYEIWYVPKTKGAVNDVVTLVPNGPEPELGLAVYEFNMGLALGSAVVNAEGSASENFLPPNFVTTPIIPITLPSVLVALYRDSLNLATPTNPSGIQFHCVDISSSNTFFDSYQFVSGPAAAYATLPGILYPAWSILASAFTVVGAGCPQDLPTSASTGGVGCSTDLFNGQEADVQRWQGFSRLNASGQPAPSCTVSVYSKGTSNLASIYSANNTALPQANPFTAGTDGFALFYAANGRYDIQFSSGGIVTPWSYGDVLLYDPGTVGS